MERKIKYEGKFVKIGNGFYLNVPKAFFNKFGLQDKLDCEVELTQSLKTDSNSDKDMAVLFNPVECIDDKYSDFSKQNLELVN